ncbi:MAG: carbamoyltransferase C-terminal domain-containing protein [Candidatus Scalindua sp.]
MKILGITDSHNSSACILENGNIIAACEEERFSRVKSDNGFPLQSVKVLLEEFNWSNKEIDYVAVSPTTFDYISFASKRYQKFGVKGFLAEQERFWEPVLEKGINVDYMEVLKEFIGEVTHIYPLSTLKDPSDPSECREMRLNSISKLLDIDKKKIIFVDHHMSHAFHAYFSSPFRKDCLCLTADSCGDNINATVNIIKNGRFKNILRTNTCNIARIYRLITLFLRMVPMSHEYKVMGLAAYAKKYAISHPYNVFKETLYVDGLDFKYKNGVIKDHYEYFKKHLSAFRFDAIAGALQQYTEELLATWVRNAINHTGLHNVVFGGGVAQNVKAMQIISEMPEVKDIFVCSGTGDESLSIGAAQNTYYEMMKNYQERPLQPLKNSYLGPSLNAGQIEEAISEPFIVKHYEIKRSVSEEDIAGLLSKGEAIGIMFGRMEFGPRALGHRSIIADPRDCAVVRKINDAIKNRDFWMPFAPSILQERAFDYIKNPKYLTAPYMTITFNTTSLARKEIIAAVHSSDFTTRPQIITEESHGRYYRIVKEFEKLTGVGAVLNTSFNIHGKPIVCKPIDVIKEILMDSNVFLKYILFDDVLLVRKK